MKRGIKRIVVVGRDVDAWLSALTLHILFGRNDSDIEIELLELPSLLGPQDFFSTLSTLKVLHKRLGLSETQVLKRAAGLYAMGQRYANWSGAAAPFMHAYDTHGLPMHDIEFLHYWLRAKTNGLDVALEDFSLGAAAAKQGRFVLLNDTTRKFSCATHGYHLSALEYTQTMGAIALQAGLKHQSGALHSVHIRDGNIESIELSDGSSVKGDFFIDASGDEAVLISKLQGSEFENWRCWFLSDAMIVADAPPLTPVPAYAQISAFDSGWSGMYPLANRTGIRTLYSSKYSSRERSLDSMATSSGMHIQNAIYSPINPGIRRQAWISNCVALGHSAACIEPLDAIDLAILQAGLFHFISLFPVDLDSTSEAEMFNQKMQSRVERLRDFQLAHYKLNQRYGEPFWDVARAMDVPESLQHKIELFSRCGNFMLSEEETFQEENWTSIFVGHGLLPESFNPLVERVPEQEQIEKFQKMLTLIAKEVHELPSLQAHVEMIGWFSPKAK